MSARDAFRDLGGRASRRSRVWVAGLGKFGDWLALDAQL